MFTLFAATILLSADPLCDRPDGFCRMPRGRVLLVYAAEKPAKPAAKPTTKEPPVAAAPCKPKCHRKRLFAHRCHRLFRCRR